MIRGLALILGLMVGLAGAVIVGGRMAHLRALTGDNLPAWTAGLDDSAGVLRGQGRIDGAELRWHLAGVDWQGPRWSARLNTADWQMGGTVHFRGVQVTVAAVNGVLPAAWLAPDGQGLIAIGTGQMTFDWRGGALIDGQIVGHSRDVTLGTALLDGAVTLVWTGDAWRVD